jgi:hypothetical protein
MLARSPRFSIIYVSLLPPRHSGKRPRLESGAAQRYCRGTKMRLSSKLLEVILSSTSVDMTYRKIGVISGLP